MRKLEKQGVTNMSVNGNIGAFITSADTIEIRFSDNEKLDVDHIDENNNEKFKEFRENENKKEELDYYIQKILNRNKDLKNIDFEEEYRILKALRNEFSANDIEIRVDANGAFQATEALRDLERLATLQLHSIEQPISAGQWEAMAELCEQTPLAIALDEELIGVFTREEKQRLLREIQPQYIILKPSLIGGYSSSEEWITLSETLGIGWWVTSALESNIGLNAIAQWTYTLHSSMPQGLGTGTLYTNNIPFPLYVKNGHLGFNPCERVTFPFS